MPFFGDIVHTDRDAQDGRQADQVRADVTVAEHAVIGAPVGHHGIHIPERTRSR